MLLKQYLKIIKSEIDTYRDKIHPKSSNTENAEEFLKKPFPDNTSDAYLLLTFDGNS